jgi:hypothetical protein
MGIIGNRFVSDFSLEVSMFLRQAALAPYTGWKQGGTQQAGREARPPN